MIRPAAGAKALVCCRLLMSPSVAGDSAVGICSICWDFGESGGDSVTPRKSS